MRISVDAKLCTGHGRCYSLAPEVFDGDDDGYGFAREEVVDEQHRATAERAVASCPEQAISIR
jgi:ferredoxin